MHGRLRVRRGSRAERGQALPLGLALLLVGCLGALVLFNTGQVATDKARLANAADSAAYSGLLWQARALNFQAYTNRAMVANEVSMAQAVSLHSWMTYGTVATEKLATALSWVPFINGISRAIANTVDALATVIKPITEAMIRVIDPINAAIGAAQDAMFVSGFVATPEIVRSVAKASDPRFESDTAYALAGLAANVDEWNGFTEAYAADDVAAMTERRDVIMDSRDPFSEARNWEFFENFWFYSTPFTKHKFVREGQTQLTMHEGGGEPDWEWMAKDTLSWQTKIWSWHGTRKAELPIGWATSSANTRGSGRLDRTRYTDRNRKAEWLGDKYAESIPDYNGVRAFRSVSREMLEQPGHDPVLRLRTEVSMPLDDTYTSADTVAGETFATDLTGPGDVMSSISVAEVHYRRPDARKEDGSIDARAREMANGYNPYWEVRLAPVALEERLLAVGLRGVAGGGGNRAPPAATSEPLAGYDGGAGTPLAAGAGGGGLGAYAEDLATAYGVGGAAVSGLAERDGLSLASIDGLRMGDPIALIGDALHDALDDAVERIVSGALDAAVSQTQGALEATLASTDGGRTLLEARDDVLALNAEYERIRVEVAQEFQDYFDEAMVLYEGTRDELLAQIDALQTEIDAVVGAVPTSTSEAMRRLRAQRDELVEELTDDLTEKLTEIIRSHADPHWIDLMDMSANRGIVGLLLDDYFGGVPGDDVDVDEAFTWAD